MNQLRLAASILLASTVLAAAATRGSETGRFRALETRLFAGADVSGTLDSLDVQDPALQTVLRAATANPYAAADILFNGGLDEASAAAAARAVLQLRERADADAALARTLESLKTRVWSEDELARSDNEGLKRMQSGASVDFKNVLAAARGQGADLEAAVRLWRTGYEGGARAASADADPVAGLKALQAPRSSLRPAALSGDSPQGRSDEEDVPPPAIGGAPSRVSSWNFAVAGNLFNLPGKGKFLDELKAAVEKGSKSDWQGPSFDAHAWALTRESTAKEVAYNTDIPEKELLSGMQYLKEKGFFRHLPSAGSVRTGIDPKEIDRIGAAALGEDSAKVLDQDGAKYKALHLFGFSSSDRAEFDAALKALAKDVKKGRWENVKITLFYTGKDQKDLAAGAYVITSKGALRAVTADEHGEPYIEHVANPGAYKKPKFKPIPYPKVRRASLKTIGDAIVKMYVSHAYPSSFDGVAAGDGLFAREREAIRSFILDEKIPDALKRVRLTRYSVDDGKDPVPEEALAEVMALAKKKGIPFPFITDFNVSMAFEFQEGMHAITDFSGIKTKDDPAGRFIQRLLDAGYVIAGPGIELTDEQKQWAIYSQPMYNKGDSSIDPIMHEKSTLLVVEKDPKDARSERKIDFYFGTANLAKHQRYNRILLIRERNAAEYAYRHFDNIIAAFSEGKTIAEIESEPPIRIYAEDDSFMEFGYTNGQYNYNERKSQRYERALQDPQNIVFKRSLQSHFAPTFSPAYELLKEVMRVSKDAVVEAITDAKFIGPRGYGKAAQMSGVMLVPQFGKTSYGWAFDLAKRVTQWIWIKQATGEDGKLIPQFDREGPPVAVEVWHDKTDEEWYVEFGVPWVYVDTGSLNKSGHADNAELQAMFRFHADSPWVKAFEDSVLEVIKANPQYAIKFDPGVLQLELANMLGHNDYEIGADAMRKIEKATFSADLRTLESELSRIGDSKTDLRKNMHEPAAVADHVTRFVKFVDWYSNELVKRSDGIHPGKLWFNKAVALATLIGHPDIKAVGKKQLLNKILWPSVKPDPDQLEKLIGEAWTVLGFEEEMPGPWTPKDKAGKAEDKPKKGGRRRVPAKP